MNPSFPAVMNNIYGNSSDSHATNSILGEWLIVYSWPPEPQPPPTPKKIIFTKSTILQSALFKCRCMLENDKTCPINVNDGEKVEAKPCELVESEDLVEAALSEASCQCKTTPFSEKIVVLPIQGHLLMYQVKKKKKYTADNPNTCLLMVKSLPFTERVEAVIEDMELLRRKGGFAYQIQNQ